MAWDDVAPFFEETAVLAPEYVIYRPSGGRPRTIRAIVERNPPELLVGADHARSLVFRIRVTNDAVTGIASDTIDTGGDHIDVAARLGQAKATRTITQLLSHDARVMVIEAR